MDKLLTYLNEERGRRMKVADVLSISPSALSMWTRVPWNHVLKLEELTGLSRCDLRPDLYPREEASAA